MADGLESWIRNLEVPGSNPPLCHSIGFVSSPAVVTRSTPLRLVNSQLVCLPPIGNFTFYLFMCLQCPQLAQRCFTSVTMRGSPSFVLFGTLLTM